MIFSFGAKEEYEKYLELIVSNSGADSKSLSKDELLWLVEELSCDRSNSTS